jgi:hypothetical protein
MLEKIKDIERALEAKAYLSALALSLTLPDICGKVENPSHSNRTTKRDYIAWFDRYVSGYYTAQEDKFKSSRISSESENMGSCTPHFDGRACYSLRCSFLHSGNDGVETEPQIDKFELSITSDVDGVYVENYGRSIIDGRITEYHIRLDIRLLCKRICEAAREYYDNHADKSLFDPYKITILNIPEYVTKMKSGFKD